MESEQIQIEELLRQISLFQDLDSRQISSLVDRLDALHLSSGELLYNQGEMGDSLYIVYSGEILLSEGRGTDEQSITTMVMGNFFGEESVMHELPRRYTVRAVDEVTLLRINSDLFFDLAQASDRFRPTLEASEKSMELASRMTFRWLNPHESVHIVTRKHIVLLWLSLIAPVLIGLSSIIFFFLAYLTDTITPVMCAAAIIIVSIAFAIWKVIDWANDFYIVTDQRVVWMEKILGLYESRQEAPMRTLLAVELGTDQIGRIFGYGDVIVRTYTTQIVLEATSHPEEVASMIRQYWQLAQSHKLEQEEGEMVIAVREHLGLDEGEFEEQEKPPPAPTPDPEPAQKPSIWSVFWAHNFKTRYEQGSIIVYRKHWYLLLKKTWLPILCAFLVIIFTGMNISGSLTLFSTETVIVIGTALLAIIGVWWLYRFVDWRNDQYQVSTESIVDIYRRPLGAEVRKAAPIENILSMSHERIGVFGLLFNFGTVRISVGDRDLIFEGVANPAMVQQEIFMRMDERIDIKRRADGAQERARMAEWLAAYHRNAEGIREDERLRDEAELE